MTAKDVLAGTALSAFLAAFPMVAAAQATSTVAVQTEAGSGTAFLEVTAGGAMIQQFNLTVGQIKGKEVKNSAGIIGDIDKVLVNKDGEVAGFTVDAGGFLGIGSKEVIMGPDQLALHDDHFVTTLTKEQVKNLPEWKS